MALVYSTILPARNQLKFSSASTLLILFPFCLEQKSLCHQPGGQGHGGEKVFAGGVIFACRVEKEPPVEAVHHIDLPAHIGVCVALILDNVRPRYIGSHLWKVDRKVIA